ncbi:hypothetical protein [Streptomyces albidoflavus]|nr:hypothetical protein [Streptomyces sp. SID8455]
MTGSGTPEGNSQPVRTSFLSRAADAVRLVGGLAQAGYYALKTWLLFS